MSLQNLPFSYHFTLYSETKMEVFPKWLIFLSNMNKRKKNPIYFLGIFCPNVEKFKFSTSSGKGTSDLITLAH